MTDVEEEILKKFELRENKEKINSKFGRSLYVSQIGIFLESIFKKKGYVLLEDLAMRLKKNIPSSTFYRLIEELERYGIIEKRTTHKGICVFPIKNGNRRTLSDYIDTIKKKVGYKGEV